MSHHLAAHVASTSSESLTLLSIEYSAAAEAYSSWRKRKTEFYWRQCPLTRPCKISIFFRLKKRRKDLSRRYRIRYYQIATDVSTFSFEIYTFCARLYRCNLAHLVNVRRTICKFSEAVCTLCFFKRFCHIRRFRIDVDENVSEFRDDLECVNY